MDDASAPGASLELLVRTRSRFGIALSALATFVAGTALVDLWVGGAHPSRQLTLTCQLLYAFSASALATLLISAVVVRSQIAAQRTRAKSLLGVLGLVRELEDHRVAIVVPAFPAAVDGDVTHSDAAIDATVRRQLGFDPSPTLCKGWNEMGDYAYSRRDILLVTDIVRLASTAGLPPPLIISDVEFAAEMNRSLTRTDGLRIQSDLSNPGSVRHITAAIVVGLWSNVLTCHLSDSPLVPFTLTGDVGARQVDLVVPDCPDGERHPSIPRNDESERAHGLFARLYFEDFTFVVLGGIMSLGTARLGDLLTRQPPNCRDLWNAPVAHDLWAMLQFPGGRRREGPHGVLAYHHRSRSPHRRLPQFARFRDDSIDLPAVERAERSGSPVDTDDDLDDREFAFPAQRKGALTDARRVRQTIAEFDRIEGVNDSERDRAWKRVKAAAKRHNVELPPARARKRRRGGKALRQ